MNTSLWVKSASIILCSSLFACTKSTATAPVAMMSTMDWSTPDIPSLNTLSIEHLRERSYGSKYTLIKSVDNQRSSYKSYLASYQSDGLTVYARIDIPTIAPKKSGYSVLLYTHGWVGIKKAPEFNFFLDQQGSQAKYIDAFAKQGYIVITPGWRGHGTVNNLPAQGIEFMERWDNASYLSPVFYSIDMLNALDSIDSLKTMLVQQPLTINKNKVYLVGHSQGGDSALLTLAISGEDSSVKNTIAASSIFSGCFLPRLEQGKLYSAMAMTPQAFMSGDGSWTASATSVNGQVNPDFQFHFPPDWIGTVNTQEWTWQKDVWKFATVKQVFKQKYDEMYQVLHESHLTDEHYEIVKSNNNRTDIIHSEEIIDGYDKNSAINYPHFITEPIALHYSDRDYYSPLYWNEELAKRIIKHGGKAQLNEYPGNTHSLTLSKHSWFSEQYSLAGIDEMIKRDMVWFNSL